MSFTLYDEVVQDEEEVESSSQSIQIEESLLGVTPSPAAPKFYDIYDISSYNMADLEEGIQIFVIEEKISFHSMHKFSSDSFILNYVQTLLVIVSENEEEFDLFISNVAAGVQKSNNLDVLEEISYFMSDPFTLIDLDILANSYMIACTNIHNFVEGENCAFTISVGHLEPLFHTLGFDMNLF